MPMSEELLEIAFEALAKHKVALDEIKALSTEDRDLGKKSQESIDKRIAKLSEAMIESVRSEMSKIEVPKDGIDGKSIKGEKGDSIVGPAGKDGKSVTGAKGIDGVHGKDGIGIVGAQGPVGVTGKAGKNAIDGINGVGIEDISVEGDSLVISMTSGEVKQISLSGKPILKQGRGGFGPATNRAGFLSKTRDVYILNPQNGDILTYENGKWINVPLPTSDPVPVDIENFQRRTEIEAMFKTDNSDAYKALTYTSGDITAVDIYTNSGMGVKLFSKTIGYNVDNNIDTINITDEVSGDNILKALVYSNGNLANITSIYTKA